MKSWAPMCFVLTDIEMMSMDMNMLGMDKMSGTQSKEAEGKEQKNVETPKTDTHQH